MKKKTGVPKLLAIALSAVLLAGPAVHAAEPASQQEEAAARLQAQGLWWETETANCIWRTS